MVNVVVNGPVSLSPRPLAKVVRPASQYPVEPGHYFLPRVLISRSKHRRDALLGRFNGFVRGLRRQVPVAIFSIPLWPKAVAQEIEPLLPCIPNTRLTFIEGKAYGSHRPTRPLQCVLRFAAAHNHQIISVIDDACLILLVLFPVPTMPAEIDACRCWPKED